MTQAEKRRVWERLRRWREHPVTMVREEFQTEPDPWQIEALEAFPNNPRLAMKACKGPGKTAVLSWLAWNFLATRPHPRIGATSITESNIDSALWPEMAKWQNRSLFFRETFQWTKTVIFHKQHQATWWMQKRSWPKKADAEQQADALGGLHEDYAMWIGDECGGYPQALLATMEAVLASGIECHVLLAGNPTHTTGPLYRICTVDKAHWKVITITADPDNPKAWVYSPRVNRPRPEGQLSPLEHARQQIAQYGRDNPWVMVNILGEFPPSSINALLGVEEVEAAMNRKLRAENWNFMQKRLGIDVARFGDDRTVIFPRQGLASFKPIVMRHERGSAVSMDIAARIMHAKHRWGSEMEFIDDTVGWAHGVIDALRTAGVGIIPLNYAGKALDPRYKNRRSEIWMKGTQFIRDGAMLPLIPELVGELTEPTYTFVGGQFVVEPKDMLKERIGRSPDLADAYMNTHAIEDMPGQLPAEVERLVRGRNKVRHDFDPFAFDKGDNTTDHDFDPFARHFDRYEIRRAA